LAFWKLIRYPNLGIVILTQFLFYWFINQVFSENSITPILDIPHFNLLVLTTICIAASGYIINDIFDYKIDLINKPDQMTIGKEISIAKAKQLYIVVIISGTFLALYLAWYVKNLNLFLIYPTAVFIMWLYSKRLKSQPLIGNIIVALFSAFVAGIVWFAEREGFYNLKSINGIQMRNLFQFYMVFAFLATLFREVIKDMEDFKGDMENECKTLPIVVGIEIARKITFGLGFLLLGSIVYWLWNQWHELNIALILITFFLLVFPTLYTIWKLLKSTSKPDYHHSSQLAKWLMVSGLLYLMLFLVFR
jgi:4-hydroxybenzoate polyprenyltransferase